MGRKPLPIPLQGLLFWDYFASITGAGAYNLSGETMGQGVGLVRELKPAGQIVADLVAEAAQVWQSLGPRFSPL